MNMQMPDMKQMKKTVKDADRLQLCTSMDVGMKIKRKNQLHAIKSFAFHKSCNIPLLRAALILAGVIMIMVLFFGMRKKMRG